MNKIHSDINNNLTRQSSLHFRRTKIVLAVVGFVAANLIPAAAQAGSGKVTLIQTGDIHGHLLSRPNLRSDAISSGMEGGVARMYTAIQEMRKDATECKIVSGKNMHRHLPAH